MMTTQIYSGLVSGQGLYWQIWFQVKISRARLGSRSRPEWSDMVPGQGQYGQTWFHVKACIFGPGSRLKKSIARLGLRSKLEQRHQN